MVLQKWLLVLLFAGLLYLLLLSQNGFDNTQQIILGWSGLLLLGILYKLQLVRQPPWRFIFILLSAFLALRYILWRSLESLVYTGPIDFIAMALLFLAEGYSITILLLGVFVNVWPLTKRSMQLPGNIAELPIVDVLVPTYNESTEIIRTTITAATQMEYPQDRLRVHICDDGGTLHKRSQSDSMAAAWVRHYELRQLARELGVNYITRETNHRAKAGNLNHALKHTAGDLILVLDCDHVPTKNMLQQTVGYFLADPKLFLVQTPHFFINPTPVEKNLIGIGNPSSENDMFYRSIHPSLDSWNASYFCGSAAILRRSHLMEAGGISIDTITEDAETSLKLHCKGYNSIYVETPMVCGLSPESYDDYVAQRRRWAQGMAQMLIMKNPLFASGLTWYQRLCYFNSCFFWFFGFARFFYFIAPALFLVIGLKIYHASGGEIIAFILPYVLSTFIIMDFLYAKARRPFFSEIYESVQTMSLTPAIISVFLNPFKPSFNTTPKGQTQAEAFLSPLATAFLFIIILNAVALVLAFYKWFYLPMLQDVILITGAWCLYNLYLALISLGTFWEQRQMRHYHRFKVSDTISITFPRKNFTTEATVTDLSLSGIGFKVQTPFSLSQQEQIILDATQLDTNKNEYRFQARLIRAVPQQNGYLCGAELVLDARNYAKAVSLVYGASERWENQWENKSAAKDTPRMLWHFFLMGIKGTGYSAAMLITSATSYLKNRGIGLLYKSSIAPGEHNS